MRLSRVVPYEFSDHSQESSTLKTLMQSLAEGEKIQESFLSLDPDERDAVSNSILAGLFRSQIAILLYLRQVEPGG